MQNGFPVPAVTDRRLNAKPEEISKTEGANRNGFRRAEEGNHSACYVRTKAGRWVPLTRDWTARQ